ncbi:tail fiber assembly protein [Yersinia enterocolitica]|uniref:tail fiber assembly protein n=1 Tax=Yersinia enterocolitica TaxID=630 RepID=UPI0005E09F94|nr:tail fiber assembly protein [Yersinia enterocolitica]EKN3573930.1 tail fiber assembly protein [Yersinia enterocolitica]EKN4802659.1 tail fiber assembly protein [Yersinia enterocolitica]EKN4914361.1 tail fiber assembly protein [Yersinia enterocolitica]ELI8151689.1 tail fiber assembly protein [Yersinia enterocolitica]CQJ13533.1 tail fiber assembly protein G [Yersinia enterocolitica]
MGRYAVVSDKGVVTNTIEYDGVAETHNDPKPVPIDDLPVNAGDKYLNGLFYLKPHDGYEYVFNTDSLEWNITAAGQEAKNADEVEFALMTKNVLLSEAYSTISLWQTKLALGMISDSDKQQLIAWVNYIALLDAVDVLLPQNIEWPVKPGESTEA